MEKQKRRRFSADYKAKIVIEALKERNTIEQLAAKYEFLSNASLAFSADSGKPKEKDSEIDKLYAQIGQLTVENNWLKKKLN